jgi:hypothetical protein
VGLPTLGLALPVGISFYTFQALSYVVDVYRGEKAQRNAVAFGTYITMFPQLVAGPIVRYADIKAELSSVTNDTPKVGAVGRMTAKLGVEMSSLTDSSDKHIAQMAIESTTMSITDNIRLVRDYENSNCRESALKLAKNVVSFQENAAERMKSFL